MLLILASFLLFFYVAASLFLFSRYKPAVKWLSSLLLLAVSLKYVVYEQIGGSFVAPALPRALLLTMETLYASLILLFFMLLLKDLVLLALWIGRRFGMSGRVSGRMTGRVPLTPVKAGLVIAALTLGMWGTFEAVRVPAVHTVEVRLANLPQSMDGFSIVQLTDTHIGPILKKDWLQQVVNTANALSPDIIALTGDYIDGRVRDLGQELLPLGDLRAKYGVYGVTGNHEYYWGPEEWTSYLQAIQVTMLYNEHRVLAIGENKLVIAGMPDISEQRFGGPGPDIQKTMANAPDAPRILLEHQPRDAAAYADFADIQLSGHTHGGLMFFLQPLIARFNNGYVNGLYDVDGMQLYVSPGTGLWAGLSSRIGVPSEITRIVLRPGK